MGTTIFKAGDEVTCVFYGDIKFILNSNQGTSDRYPVAFTSPIGVGHTFTMDGKELEKHFFPVLKLVRTKEQIEEENKPAEWFEVFYKLKDNQGARRSARLVRSEEEYLELNSRVKEDYEWLKLRRIE